MENKWITFDLDGTLMQNPFGKWVFPEINRIVKKENKYAKDIHSQLVLEHKSRMDKDKIVEAYDWDDILQEVIKRNGLQINLDIEKLVISHSISPKVYLLEEDLLASLEKFKEKGFSLAAVTNGYYKYQLPVLKTLGLLPYFDLVITPDREGYAKPNIKMLKRLIEKATIVAHVGDRIDHDIVFSNELGIAPILMYKNMPESLMKVDPRKRIESDICINYCINKWGNETGINAIEFKEKQKPEIVIHSVGELLSLV